MPRPTSLPMSKLLGALSPVAQGASELAKQLNVSRATVHRHIEPVLAHGIIEKVGQGPHAGYRLPDPAEKIAAARGDVSRHVRLVTSESAIQALGDALENYSRIGIGQFNMIVEMSRCDTIVPADGSKFFDYAKYDKAEDLSGSLKDALMRLDQNASHGILSSRVHESIQASWQLYVALRHRLAWDRTPEGSGRNSHDEPMHRERVQGFAVFSETVNGARQYIVEMPPEILEQMFSAVMLMVQVTRGEMQAIVDLAREGLLVSAEGHRADEEDLFVAAQIANHLSKLLIGDRAAVQEQAVSAHHRRLVSLAQAMAAYLGKPIPEGQADADLAIELNLVGDHPHRVSVDSLPKGMLLTVNGDKFRVVVPSENENYMTVIAESSSVQTVLQMAQNHANGVKSREFRF